MVGRIPYFAKVSRDWSRTCFGYNKKNHWRKKCALKVGGFLIKKEKVLNLTGKGSFKLKSHQSDSSIDDWASPIQQ